MISFLICLVALVAGYFLYGAFVERVFGPDDRPTPAVAQPDGVDYVPMPLWRVFMIQFLNIAGTGPIFGAIMGIWFGPAALLWIVFGCIFAGAVHDYFSGMLSLRHGGGGLPTIVGDNLGTLARRFVLLFVVLLLMMVGTVFVYSPALILGHFGGTQMMWIAIIFAYYILATMLPIDKLIGRVYPLFAASLLFMALALLVVLVVQMPALPEIWDIGAMNAWRSFDIDGRDALGINTFLQTNSLFPCLFITVACGAISGFHATQSPLMARCLVSERLGRRVFYGAMITEGAVALVWAMAASYFFYGGGWQTLDPDMSEAFRSQFAADGGKTLIQYYPAPVVVKVVCTGFLGTVGGVLAMLGVVAAPITSGDTAFRSVRLTLADALNLSQKTIAHRLMLCVPLFGVAMVLLWWQIGNPNGFNVIWQYFGWSNQTLSVFTLWTVTVWLARNGKPYFITLVPALLMTSVCSTFVAVSPQAFGGPAWCGAVVGIATPLAVLAAFALWHRKQIQKR